MPLPPLPTAGQQWSYRAIGVTLPQRSKKGRQVRWEDQTTAHTDHPTVLAFLDDQRFECRVTYTYTGTNPLDPFEQTGPVLTDVFPIPHYAPDPAASKALWDRIMAKAQPPEPPEPLDEAFWLKPKDSHE